MAARPSVEAGCLCFNGLTETAVQVVFVTRQLLLRVPALALHIKFWMLGRQDARDSFGQVLNRC